ncbi:MAG: ABC transporter permease [Candidatus Hodarchaeales archaeon]|jgi:peptide/nickel transport system permease protein
MGLKGYIARRFVYSLILLIAVIIFNFFLFRLPTFMWGLDPADLVIGGIDDDAMQAQLRRVWGIPPEDATLEHWINHFIAYMINMITFNFGNSFQQNTMRVVDGIWERLPNTVILLGIASVATMILGIYLGTKAASRRGSRFDMGNVTFSLFMYSVPIFWSGMISLLIFSVWFNIFPLYGSHSNACLAGDFANCMTGTNPPLDFALDYVWHLFLPVTVLTIGGFGGYLLLMRNSLVDVMTEDYIKTARAKGLSERTVLYKHAFRNAVLPMLTVIALTFAFIIDGAVLTETVFNWYGLGRYIFDSLIQLDWPVSQAIFFIIALCVIIANFVADMMYGVLDPRIKYV